MIYLFKKFRSQLLVLVFLLPACKKQAVEIKSTRKSIAQCDDLPVKKIEVKLLQKYITEQKIDELQKLLHENLADCSEVL